jgi:hypothetical protein
MATKKLLKEDVVKGTKEDIQKKFKPKLTKARGAARTSVKEAAKSAGGRLAKRAFGVIGAADAGVKVGKFIEEKTNIGKKIGAALFDADKKLDSFSKAQAKKNREIRAKRNK